MDIGKIIHAINNKRQVVLWGLDADADESDRIKAKTSFDEVSEMLKGMASGITSKVEEEDGKPTLEYSIRGIK